MDFLLGSLKSKTMWFALAVTIIGIWDQLSPFIPPDQLSKVVTVVGPVIAILRMLTKESLKAKADPDQ